MAVATTSTEPQVSEEERKETLKDNQFSQRVVGIGIFIVGLVVLTLGLINTYGRIPVICVSALLILLGIVIYLKNLNKHDNA